jgi:hypothetical protein
MSGKILKNGIELINSNGRAKTTTDPLRYKKIEILFANLPTFSLTMQRNW